tara:strand:- start:197 stop:397 length:201 start_codon:yes stop_codon:yes gene_type:complete
MKLDWDQQVGERWIPFHGWLQDNYGFNRLNKLNKKEKISLIKQYLVVFPSGMSSRWDVHMAVRKHY